MSGSVRVRLLRLSLLLVLPGLGISALLAWRTFTLARRGAEQALLATSTGMVQLVDRQFAEADLLLRTLAATDELRAGRLGDFARLARATALQGADTMLVDAAGRVLVNTAMPAGAPAGGPVATLGWAQETIGLATVSPLVNQGGTGALSAHVVLPVGVNGRHVYDLAVVLPAVAMQHLLLAHKLPSGWVASIMDSNQVFVARTKDPERFVGRRAGADLLDDLARRVSGVRDTVALDGTRLITAFSQSGQSRWTVAVASPRSLVAQVGEQSLVLVVLLGTAALLAGLLGALAVTRSIARPIEAMAQSARRLGESGSWTPIPPGLAEADAVARAMYTAAHTLVERGQALRELNASLAKRIEARTGELGRANAALDDQRQQLNAILDHIPVGVVVHHTDGKLRFVNIEARRMLGLVEKGDVDPATWPAIHRNGAVLPRDELPSARARAGVAVGREILSIHPPDRPRVELEVNASPLLGPGGQVALALTTMQDATARLEAEEARRRSQRLEVVGQLTGGVAHEFNNLLMAISGCLELLGPHVSGAFGAGSRAVSLLANATRAAGRGAGLTGQLLAFARRQTLQVEAVDLNALVAGMMQLLEGTLGRSVEVELLADPATWPAMADAAQIELVLLNLAINARDAMPAGGRLTIRTESIRTGIPFRAEDPPMGDHAVLHVSDTGHGMPDHVLARAFEPFFTTKDVGRGSGLGLPQVLGVAQQLGGGVTIISQPGMGTTVSLFLPRADSAPVPSRAGKLPPPAANALSGARLLLVDDDADVREIARSMLETMGAEVLEASSGAGALLILRTVRIDLMLADLTMPKMTGIELAHEAASVLPDLPIVLMTGYGAATMGDPGPHVRATLLKPFRAETLARTLLVELGLVQSVG